MATVAQWFPQVSQAHQAVLDLLTSGVPRQEIGVLVGPERAGQAADVRSGQPDGGSDGASTAGGSHPHDFVGALTEATTVTLPGLGQVAAAGPLAGAFAGAKGETAAAMCRDALSALGLSEGGDGAALLAEGGALVTVSADEIWETIVRGVFRHNANPGLSNPGEVAGPEAGSEAADASAPPSASVGALTGGIVPAGWGTAASAALEATDDSSPQSS